MERGCPAQPPNSKSDPQALETVSAKRVSKICIYGVGGDDPVRADGALRSRAGQPISLSQVHEDVRTLMASARFEDVEVSAIPRGDEAIVLFQLRERPSIAEVTFEGATMLQKEGLEPKIAPASGKPIAIANVYDAAMIIRDEYHRRGYRRAAINIVTEQLAPDRVRMKIVVSEGRPFRFGPIRLNGVSKAREADLRKATQLEPGMAFDDDAVLSAVRSFEDFYIDHGFPTAQVAPTIGEPAPDGTTAVSFDIAEGELVRFGPVTIASIEGAKLKVPPVKLKSKHGETFSRTAIDDDVRAVVAAFAARGQKIVVVPRRELDPKKRTISVVFQVAPAPM
jgi:outer membrane protein insertion porin family